MILTGAVEPTPDTWAPLYSVDPSVLKVTGGSISPFPTTLIKLAASVPTASAATEPSPALLPKYVAREFQNPEDKVNPPTHPRTHTHTLPLLGSLEWDHT